MKPYTTPPEIAELLRVKADRVRKWIENGELIAANLGDASRPRYRIAAADLQAFLDRRSAVRKPIAQPRRRRHVEASPERH